MCACVSGQMLNFAYGDKYAAFLYDAVMLYAIALNESMTKGLDYDKRPGVLVRINRRLELRHSIVSGLE